MEISSSNLSFRISLVDVDELKIHEEVIQGIVRSLATAMEREGGVRDPLIVDRDELVILDGMHRFSSLRLLKCRFAPCCLVDYDSPLIRVGAWFRLFVVKEEESLAEKLLTENNLAYSKRKILLQNASHNSDTIILTSSGTEFSLLQSTDPLARAKIAVLLENAMVRIGYRPEYLSEIVAMQRLTSGDGNFVIALPIFTKEQIRHFGTCGLLLPHKVTRHVIPSRPLRIDVPLRMLRESKITQPEANQRLGELLVPRRVERKPPGSTVDGRRYEEELLVFSS